MDYRDIRLDDCPNGSEGELMLFALDRVHREFAWKTGGLDAEQLRRRHPPSKLTLAGLIKHLTGVESGWTARAVGPSYETPWGKVDWIANPRWDFDSAVTDDPEELYATWYATIERSRRTWATMINNDGLDVTLPWGGDDYIVNRRRALTDILEENLLHTGHASIIREAIDGLVGNGPP
ncbi:DUF664 domain-containing protein [Microlunatus speluncae]|uniref:mycothiol transferase n=1 Tax=Microlunatus speluncae TaxID=2594267 RepID=UPI00126679EE|nr:DUF664 domain-containing protein [Microlunatus speluncae]